MSMSRPSDGASRGRPARSRASTVGETRGRARARDRRASLSAVALSLVVALLLAACGNDSASDAGPEPIAGDGGTDSADPADEVTPGGNFTIIAEGDVTSFDPANMGAFALGSTAPIAATVYDSLIYLDRETGEEMPGLLESVTGSEDALTWTMNIRPGVEFSDGTPFDAEAVKANFDHHAASETSPAQGFAATIAEWDVSDPLVAEVTLAAPDATFVFNLINRVNFMASPAALEEFGEEYGSSPETTVGAGPFVLSSWSRDSEIRFTRNEGYWDAPRPYLDTVTFRIITDRQQAYNTVLTGGADTMQSPTQEIQDQADAAGMTIEQYYPNTVAFRPLYYLNLQRPPFDDLLARQALYAALDPEVVSAASGQEIATSVFEEGTTWYSDKGAFPPYDPERAQELIDEWSANNGGAPLEFTVTDVVDNTVVGGQGETIQAAFAAYDNVVVNLERVTFPALTEMGPNGAFDLYPGAIGGVDPTGFLMASYSTGGSRNFGGYSSPEMDAALEARLSTTDFDAQKEAFDRVQELLMTDLPTWYLPIQGFATNHWIVSNEDVRGWGGGYMTGPMTSQIWIAQ